MQQSISPSRPRLLLVGNFLSLSGVSPGVGEELAACLQSRNWNLITTSTRANRLARLLDMLYTVWQRRNDYDLVSIEVYSGPAFIWAEAIVWMLRRLRKPYILTLHGGNLPFFSRRWPRRVARLMAHAQTVTTPSRYLQAELNILRKDMHLIPNLLDIKSYPFTLRRSAAPRLVWLRAFHRLYNPLLAIETLSRLVKEFPDIELAMVGPDRGDGSLQQISQAIQRASLTGRVRLVGGVPKREVPHWLAQRDIFLNTSSVDNTPVSVIEAMACGLCIASTFAGGIPYLLQDGETALLVPPSDPDAMARAVQRILNEAGLAQRLSENAHREAQRFDQEAVLPQWEALFGAGE